MNSQLLSVNDKDVSLLNWEDKDIMKVIIEKQRREDG